uniref:TMEM9 family protein n=1 Tax=Cuerna arida TaxID=1464854 RepID=A0A1B6ERE5_9HEMI
MKELFYCVVLFLAVSYVKAQSYEDARCKCVCTVVNGTQTYKKLYIANVPPNNDCDGVSVPVVDNDNKTQELCPRCECKYESRNTTIIKVVVIIVIWIISLLVIYMLFLICLDPLLNKRAKSSYVEHTNEDDESGGVPAGSSHQMGVRGGNVLNRVGHQQDKWKKQVREQRKNIYDRHTMLN